MDSQSRMSKSAQDGLDDGSYYEPDLDSWNPQNEFGYYGTYSTIISIPIPITVPVPFPSGSSSGPVIINPPAPPPPPPPPPAQLESRTTPLQDMTSLMMAMMLKDTMKGSLGDLFPSRDSQSQEKQSSDQPAQEGEGEQDVKGVLSVITANAARKKENKLKAEKEDKNQPEPADKDNKETKEEPAAAASKSGADEVILLDSSDSTTSTKSDEDESGEEQEPEELGTAYESATARCGRKCCLLILVLFLTGLVVANVAFTLTPRRFSNFLCEHPRSGITLRRPRWISVYGALLQTRRLWIRSQPRPSYFGGGEMVEAHV
ncbi:uncharacterized protein LOC142817522 [Rhipicephalus microplus]|uniref:uncharacterized protein LOC142817522 n=1 Tax=Rhipicephalus microplus TaxID=6941 RepID=UPI003F6A6832